MGFTVEDPTTVLHLSSLTPEKSTSCTPGRDREDDDVDVDDDVNVDDDVDVDGQKQKQKRKVPSIKEASGDILTATLVGSFLSYLKTI